MGPETIVGQLRQDGTKAYIDGEIAKGKSFASAWEGIFGSLEYTAVMERNVGREITIDIQADGFLYNMVRNITGALVEIGRGRFDPIWLEECLKSRQRALESQTAPARGLCMMNVEYPAWIYLDSDPYPSETTQGV
jgi:tRNA U38,U39,U40 pseudouridine synthase TruA